HALDQLPVIGARLIQPEDRRLPGGSGAAHRQLHPVAYGGIPGLAHAPDVAGLHLVFGERAAGGVDHTHRARLADLEGLVVRAVFLGRLRHQADVAHVAHGGHVEGAVGAAVVDHGLVYTGIAAVGDDRDHVVQLAVRTPHPARGTDGGGHRGVDDHVAGHMQVGDALVRIDHGQR